MSINIGPPAVEELRPRITVIGVGGAGGNAIANMIGAGDANAQRGGNICQNIISPEIERSNI